ncbi:MAG: GatB/YqeY domain-containing protein [Candidatus Spechtbacteria bacterium]|nr:GatB/YqeY domain-containing protein [Candidatus Spechtbacteria bacterium]
MPLKERIQADIKEALRTKDERALLVLRSLVASIGNKAIELGKKAEGLSEEETEKVILSEIKKRKEAQGQYAKGGRQDLVESERLEEEVLKKYAPEQMSDDELGRIIDDIIQTTGAAGPQDMGKVIKEVMARVGTRASGSSVSALVKEKLK